MIDERLRELMNGEIDGENSAEESRELREALGSDEEARRYFDDLAELGRRFESAGGIDPPPALRRRILESTTRVEAAGTPGVSTPSRPARRSLADSLREAFTPRLAYAFAAGVAVGAILLVVVSGPGREATRVSPEDVRGTMAPRGGGLSESPGYIELDLPAAEGSGSVSYSPDEIRLDVSLLTYEDVSVVLTFEGAVAPASIRVYSGDTLTFDRRLEPAP